MAPDAAPVAAQTLHPADDDIEELVGAADDIRAQVNRLLPQLGQDARRQIIVRHLVEAVHLLVVQATGSSAKEEEGSS
jgi:hypothetical protein